MANRQITQPIVIEPIEPKQFDYYESARLGNFYGSREGWDPRAKTERIEIIREDES